MSIVLETRSTRSILTAVVQTLIKPFGDYLLKHDKPEPAGSKRLVPLSIATKRCKVVESFVADTWLYTFSQNREKATATPPERILYYFAGGGFRAPPAKEHWAMCAELCCRLPRYAIILVSYPLAPASPASR